MPNINEIKQKQYYYINRYIQDFNIKKKNTAITTKILWKDLTNTLDQIDQANSKLHEIKKALISHRASKSLLSKEDRLKIREVLGEVLKDITYPDHFNIIDIFIDDNYDSCFKDTMQSYFNTILKEYAKSSRDTFKNTKNRYPSILKNTEFDELPELVNKIEQIVLKNQFMYKKMAQYLYNLDNISTDKLTLSSSKLYQVAKHNEIIAKISFPAFKKNELFYYAAEKRYLECSKNGNKIVINCPGKSNIRIHDLSNDKNSVKIDGVPQGGYKTLSYEQYKDGIKFTGKSDLISIAMEKKAGKYTILTDTQFLSFK